MKDSPPLALTVGLPGAETGPCSVFWEAQKIGPDREPLSILCEWEGLQWQLEEFRSSAEATED